MIEKVKVLENIAEEWNSANINYAVAHGLENYPDSVGRDLDILISSEHVDRAIEMAKNILTQHQFVYVLPPALWGKRILGIKSLKAEEYIEIHTIKKLIWRSVTLGDLPNIQKKVGPFKIDPWISFVKRILLPFLAGEIERFKHKPNEFCFKEGEREIVSKRIQNLCGKKCSSIIFESIENNNLEKIQNSVSKIQNRFLLYSLCKRPLNSLLAFIKLLYKNFSQPFQPCGPIIAIVGTDGVGKSTVIKNIKIKLHNSFFTNVVIRHWRPGLIPPLNNLYRLKAKRINTTETFLPRKEPGKFQWLRLCYYSFDFIVGNWLKDRIESAKQKVVIYDRCALDMVVDPVRYGLSSSWGIKLIWRLIPKPDKVILLYDDPERIYNRKPELSITEIDRQLKKWLQLHEKGWVDAIIKIEASPEIIAERIQHLIIEAFIQKNHSFIPDSPLPEEELAGNL